jgi:hypothetical protein
MKELIVTNLVLFIFLISACDNSIGTEDGKLISNTLCKNEKTETDETCVEYSYNNETKTLSLKHINTAFNCCPKALYVEVSIDENTITIDESERTQECNCMCLYDMEIEVYNIENQVYSIKFKEPYVADEFELRFQIDLAQKPEDTYCLHRETYPWQN